MPMDKQRSDFLIKMYEQLSLEINRHILIVWQPIGIMVGSLTLLHYVENKSIPINVAMPLIYLSILWLFANIIDCNYWYNRNQAMITNIEKEFLNEEDISKIHYYFGKHKKYTLVRHFKIQFYFAMIFTVFMTCYYYNKLNIGDLSIHFIKNPSFLLLFMGSFYISWFYDYRISCYNEFIRNSPGKLVLHNNTNYPGRGHVV